MRKNTDEHLPFVYHPDTVPTVLLNSVEDSVHRGTMHYRAYMPSTLEDYQPIVPVLDALNYAGAGDTISIILNGDGGYVTTAAHLSTAFARSEAVVITEAYGRVSSAHTLTMLCGDVILPVRNTIVMSHNMSMGTGGSGDEPIKHVQASLDWCYSLFEEHQLPFLSLEEIQSIFDHNNTIWLPVEQDVNNRIFTTMWYRAVMGSLKPGAFKMFIELVQAGTYESCELTNINTLLAGLETIDEQYSKMVSDIWDVMRSAGLFKGDSPTDYVLSIA